MCVLAVGTRRLLLRFCRVLCQLATPSFQRRILIEIATGSFPNLSGPLIHSKPTNHVLNALGLVVSAKALVAGDVVGRLLYLPGRNFITAQFQRRLHKRTGLIARDLCA